MRRLWTCSIALGLLTAVLGCHHFTCGECDCDVCEYGCCHYGLCSTANGHLGAAPAPQIGNGVSGSSVIQTEPPKEMPKGKPAARSGL
ncbi:MAG: hypothetical protein NZ700_11615 [Gemmataceae bacterium]|nr:hypothetical protein [Gemmataceae bacterium]MDW8265607.1 hypothetical protein [Gemmataceae bacterium]